MDKNFLSKTILFQGISPDEVQGMLGCLGGETKSYRKGNVIYHMGEIIHSIGIVLSGSVSIENNDVWGNKSILEKAGPGQVFAEAYACIPNEPLMISIVATEPTEILFLDVNRVLHVCSNACSHHSRVIRNLLSVSFKKNLGMTRRIFHTSSKSIRGRLLSYLSFQANQHDSCDFEIPFSRQQLADYLSVDRSAMSNELSKMQKEGLLQVDRNHFTLIGIDLE